MKRFGILATAAVLAVNSGYALACGGDNSGKHMGTVLDVNAASFTIRDAETASPLTFSAPAELLKTVSSGKNVVVDFEETEDGAMKATMVSPAAF